MPETIEKHKLLLVEGKDDKNFYSNLLNHLGIEDIQIISINGKGQFSEEINALQLATGFSQVKSIGIIRDADNNANGAFQSLSAILRRNHLHPPDISGQVIEHSGIKIGIFISPDNQNIGAVEDLIIQSINNAEYFGCVENFFMCPHEERLISSKAKVQAYLALLEPLANNIGYAAMQNHWNWDHDCFASIKAFMEEL
jgi:hypothetical protein